MPNGRNCKFSAGFVVAFFVVCGIFSTLIPPFQSPDEFEHIKRAYWLGKGQILLNAPEGRPSGGMVDSGLLSYMSTFDALPFHPETKLTAEARQHASNIGWTQTKEFAPALGQAFYFPGIYAIHALGLFVGERFDFSLDATYRLTKFLLILTTSGLLLLAFRLVDPPPVVYALLVIPMSLFQFSSASLDGIATALSLLIISAFLRMMTSEKPHQPWLFFLALFAWMLVASSRVHLFAMILMAFAVCLRVRRLQFFAAVFMAASLVVLWEIIAIKTVVDGRVQLNAPTSFIIATYLQEPARLLSVFSATLSNRAISLGYFSSFFGMLGWLDAPFRGKEYIFLAALTLLIGALSVDWKGLREAYTARLVLVLCALASVASVFFVFLVAGTPHPATTIDGIQGRYFLVPCLMIAYASSGFTKKTLGGFQLTAAQSVAIILSVFSTVITANLIVERYYLAYGLK